MCVHFWSQHCTVLCLFLRGSLIGTTNLVSLSKSNRVIHFFVLILKTNFGDLLCPASNIDFFSKSVCMFVIGFNVNTADCLIFLFAFQRRKQFRRKKMLREWKLPKIKLPSLGFANKTVYLKTHCSNRWTSSNTKLLKLIAFELIKNALPLQF